MPGALLGGGEEASQRHDIAVISWYCAEPMAPGRYQRLTWHSVPIKHQTSVAMDYLGNGLMACDQQLSVTDSRPQLHRPLAAGIVSPGIALKAGGIKIAEQISSGPS
ncbi:hypothetical protein J7T55_004382 [Diaporthe amygdali]|uniref:uncharacterized protein n=1 Tax=Phomopsis amygdali TaxID=1214568 RepID=UPI0022FE6903|nr:uncharacterized protein J7T55_004382 [Diaporthe amygdali]KAJ0109832.1 hypothetical protein J7T55_004382 [Diaporthe amygdali]